MAYSSSSLLKVEHSSSLDSFLAFKARDFFSPLALTILESFLMNHFVNFKKDSKIVKAKGERKSLALKAKKESSDDECSTFRSEDEEYAMEGERKCFRCGDPNHLIRECPKPPKDKNQRAFVRVFWSDSGEEDDEKVKDETCLVAQASNEAKGECLVAAGEWQEVRMVLQGIRRENGVNSAKCIVTLKGSTEDSKPMKTPMSSDTKLIKDEECKSLDSTKYQGMIGSLLYLTAYGVPRDGPYQTNPPFPDDIISYIQNDQEGQVTRTRQKQEIDVQDHQILTREIVSTLKPLEEIIQENVFCLGVIETMFPCVFVTCANVLQDPKISTSPIIWQSEWSGSLNKLVLYLVRSCYESSYRSTRAKTRKDCGTRRGRHSISSSSFFDQPSSSHLDDDDDDGNKDEGFEEDEDDKKSGRMAYLIMKHRIEEEKHED
nr:hypothetical protein [Tanacetum cinerariifolium]